MTEYAVGPLIPITEIKEVLVWPGDERSRRELKFIEDFVNDKPVTLGEFPEDQLKRLTIDFYGLIHSPDHAPAIAEQIAKKKPDIIISETIGGSQDYRNKQDVVDNMLMRGHQVFTLMPEGEDLLALRTRDNEDCAFGQIYAILQMLGVSPLTRRMDITDEQLKFYGIADNFFDDRGIAIGMSAILRPDWAVRSTLNKLEKVVSDGLLRAAKLIRIREQIMADDISRIAANALTKFNQEDIRIAVLHGASHTSMRAKIARLGVKTSLEFVPKRQMYDAERFHFDSVLVPLREFVWTDRIKPETVTNFLIKSLLVDTLIIRSIMESRKVDIDTPEKISRVNKAHKSADMVPNQVLRELEKAWRQRPPKRLFGPKKKDRANIAVFNNALARVLENAPRF